MLRYAVDMQFYETRRWHTMGGITVNKSKRRRENEREREKGREEGEPSVEYIQAFGRHVQLIVTYDTRISFPGMLLALVSRLASSLDIFLPRFITRSRYFSVIYQRNIHGGSLCGSSDAGCPRTKYFSSFFPFLLLRTRISIRGEKGTA